MYLVFYSRDLLLTYCPIDLRSYGPTVHGTKKLCEGTIHLGTVETHKGLRVYPSLAGGEVPFAAPTRRFSAHKGLHAEPFSFFAPTSSAHPCHRGLRTSGMRPSRGRHTAPAHTPMPEMRTSRTRNSGGLNSQSTLPYTLGRT